jgi:hypothetical protein
MSLDHESGNIDAELLANNNKGKHLSELIFFYGLADK